MINSKLKPFENRFSIEISHESVKWLKRLLCFFRKFRLTFIWCSCEGKFTNQISNTAQIITLCKIFARKSFMAMDAHFPNVQIPINRKASGFYWSWKPFPIVKHFWNSWAANCMCLFSSIEIRNLPAHLCLHLLNFINYAWQKLHVRRWSSFRDKYLLLFTVGEGLFSSLPLWFSIIRIQRY